MTSCHRSLSVAVFRQAFAEKWTSVKIQTEVTGIKLVTSWNRTTSTTGGIQENEARSHVVVLPVGIMKILRLFKYKKKSKREREKKKAWDFCSFNIYVIILLLRIEATGTYVSRIISISQQEVTSWAFILDSDATITFHSSEESKCQYKPHNKMISGQSALCS